jgi:hypothetical protein
LRIVIGLIARVLNAFSIAALIARILEALSVATTLRGLLVTGRSSVTARSIALLLLIHLIALLLLSLGIGHNFTPLLLKNW